MKKSLLPLLALSLILVGCSTTQPKTYTAEEVKTHTTAEDCRTIIDGKMYDITAAFATHKNPEKTLLPICGIDASEKFNGKHGESEKAKAVLQTLIIGEVK